MPNRCLSIEQYKSVDGLICFLHQNYFILAIVEDLDGESLIMSEALSNF